VRSKEHNVVGVATSLSIERERERENLDSHKEGRGKSRSFGKCKKEYAPALILHDDECRPRNRRRNRRLVLCSSRTRRNLTRPFSYVLLLLENVRCECREGEPASLTFNPLFFS
jgi:hypothetical protein